jgi:hypothetical protein
VNLRRTSYFALGPGCRRILLGGYFAVTIGGCSVYSDLEELEPPADADHPRSDGSTPSPDGASSDRTTSSDTVDRDGTPTPDAGTDVSIDGSVDTIAPPNDVNVRDGGVDTTVGIDTAIDAHLPDVATDRTPPSDVPSADNTTRADADATVPPTPDAGIDTGGSSDVRDVGTQVDADATLPPPPDADAGPPTIDVRDAGPTCWGTPSTHDEDGDGVVDECDNCPSIANANQDDVREINAGRAADGVGDACDPRPDDSGDSIYLFDGMNFTTLPSEWINVGAGSWTASGTSLTPTSTATGQELERTFPTNLNDYLAETTFTFTALTTNGSASLPFRMDAASNGWRCAVGTPDGITGQFFSTQVTAGAGEAMPPITNIAVPQVGSKYRVLGGGYGNEVYCRLGTGQRQDRASSSSMGNSGIRATGTAARFDYLLVYRLGGTLP